MGAPLATTWNSCMRLKAGRRRPWRMSLLVERGEGCVFVCRWCVHVCEQACVLVGRKTQTVHPIFYFTHPLKRHMSLYFILRSMLSL